jgi:hypothetical protein
MDWDSATGTKSASLLLVQVGYSNQSTVDSEIGSPAGGVGTCKTDYESVNRKNMFSNQPPS